jgi:sulfonate transport system substrate-binding protein
MPKIWRAFVVVTALLGLLLVGCVSRQDNAASRAAPSLVPLSELSGVTLQIGDQKGRTEALLRAANQLENLPYQVTFSTFTSGPPQIEAATAGKIDFAATGNTPPIFGAASNAKVKVVSAYDTSGKGDRVLVHADSAITSVADLRGKSIAVAKGSNAHGNILAQLNKAGLAPTDVNFVYLQPADALGAFAQHQVDAWAIWDPYTAQAEKQIPVRSIASADGVTNGYWLGVASDAALGDPKRSTALQDLLVRFDKSIEWAQAHPQEWAASYAAAISLDPEVATVSQARSLPLPVALNDSVVGSEQRIADLFASSGQLPSSPKFADWVDFRYTDALKPYVTDTK